MMNTRQFKIYLRIFYLVLLACIGNNLIKLIYPVGIVPAFPVEMISWIPDAIYFPVKKLIGSVCVLSLLFSIYKPYYKISRFLVSFSLLWVVAIVSSHGKVVHGYYSWIFTSLILALVPLRKEEEEKAQELFFYAQFISVMGYCMAGLWKLRAIPAGFTQGGLEGLFSALGNTIAYQHLIFSHELNSASAFFIEHYWFSGTLFFAGVILQVVTPLFLWNRYTQLALCFLLVNFHLVNEYIVKIPFRPQMYLNIVLFLIPHLLTRFPREANRTLEKELSRH